MIPNNFLTKHSHYKIIRNTFRNIAIGTTHTLIGTGAVIGTLFKSI